MIMADEDVVRHENHDYLVDVHTELRKDHQELAVPEIQPTDGFQMIEILNDCFLIREK